MPEIVKELTKEEQKIEKKVLDTYTEEEICAYFLSKNLRSIYQFDDDFIEDWYSQLFDSPLNDTETKRTRLAMAYARMLLMDRLYDNHMKYWIRQLQSGILMEMKAYFSGEPGK